MIAELALDRDASIQAHSNPNLTYFLVIEGGGFVRVGDETARVSAGDAVVWPPDVIHAAWTEISPMRAIVVEFAGTPEDARLLLPGDPVLVELGSATEDGASDDSGTITRLEPDIPSGPTPTADEGEPW